MEFFFKGTLEKVINQKARFLGFLMKISFPLMICVLTYLAKNVCMSLRLTAAESATGTKKFRKILRSG